MGRLLDAASTATASSRAIKCSIGRALVALKPEDAADLRALLDDDDVAAPVIVQVLRDVCDYHTNPDAVRRHRRRLTGDGCKCGPAD